MNAAMSDNREFERLFRAHVGAVRAYAARRDPALAEDVVAETFLVCWRRLADVPRDELPWLLGIARRCLANARRSSTRRSALLERVARQPLPVEEPAATDPRVRTALALLSAIDREILLLVAWDGLDRAGVARVTGCSQATVRLRLHRARRRFAAAYLASARPVDSGGHTPEDDGLLGFVLSQPRTRRRRNRKVVVALGLCLLALGGTAAYAAFGGMDAARVDAALRQSARDARPLSAGEVAAIDRSNAADEALYHCFKSHGTATDSSNGLSPTPAVKAACANQSAAADAHHRDPAVRAAFAAEATLIGAAWYCVQQQGYEVNGNRIVNQPGPGELKKIWAAFAACEVKVGVPAAHRAPRP
jgi:RNA polymerase sigma-70 factor (ECF subfamily)